MRRRVWGLKDGLGVVKKYNEYVAMFREKFLPALKKECCIEDGKARGEEANESELFWCVGCKTGCLRKGIRFSLEEEWDGIC